MYQKCDEASFLRRTQSFILQARIVIPCNLVFGCQLYRRNELQVEKDQIYSSQTGEHPQDHKRANVHWFSAGVLQLAEPG